MEMKPRISTALAPRTAAFMALLRHWVLDVQDSLKVRTVKRPEGCGPLARTEGNKNSIRILVIDLGPRFSLSSEERAWVRWKETPLQYSGYSMDFVACRWLRPRTGALPASLRTFAALVLMLLVAGFVAAAEFPGKPNIVFILADDLGYGEIGSYGQKLIATPRIDRMAREGMRFTQFYAGATVCAPSRSVLMTGQHHGHTRVRGNAGKANPRAQALRSNDLTVARVLQSAGYRTALIGKWGLGDVGEAESGLPRRHGFDYFFGFLNQHHAHNHYPEYLWRNEEKVPLANDRIAVGDQGGGYATNGTVYADDLFADEAVTFLRQQSRQPFFLFLSLVVPHANNERNRVLKNGAEVPDLAPYADRPWPPPDQGHAAMITRMDGYVGRVLDELQRLKLDRQTLVIFTSDNGPHKESGHDAERFRPYGPLRGYKRDLTEGGIRVPFIAWWPGTVKARRVSEHVGYGGDLMATAVELAGAALPPGLDSISFVPALLGRSRDQRRHEWLYFEFHEGGFNSAAILDGRWKGIRAGTTNAPIELYDLKRDLGEGRNVADLHPDLVSRIAQYLDTARTESLDWPIRPAAGRPAANRRGARRAL
jgi:arylsulfatase A-like enzyme